MGIHSLHRTPGKLLTARGSIPGVLGAFGTVWGKLSMTGDKAEANMGFRPKEGAMGVQLCRKRYVGNNGKVKSGIFAISLMPRKTTPTKKLRDGQERMRVIGKIVSNHTRDIIYPIWEPLVKNRNRFPWDGCRYFLSVNNINVGNSLDWSKLQLSAGRLSPPKYICANRYDIEKGEIQLFLPQNIGRKPIIINQMGIGIFDRITEDFFHISPERVTEELEKRFKASGITAEDLKKARINYVIEPLRFRWELKKVRRTTGRLITGFQTEYGLYQTANKCLPFPYDRQRLYEHIDTRQGWIEIYRDFVQGLGVRLTGALGSLVLESCNVNKSISIYEEPCRNGIDKWMRSEHLRFYLYNYYKRISPVNVLGANNLPCREKPKYSASICKRIIPHFPGEDKDKIEGKYSVPIVIEIIEKDMAEHIMTR
jgi:hypothetical protein